MISWENYEEYMMLYADGELSHAEETALLGFVAAHPELGAELDAYRKARLTPDLADVYEEKALLIKPLPAKRIVLSGWMKYAVAAGILLLIGVPLIRFMQSNPEMPVTAGRKDTMAAPMVVKTVPTETASAPRTGNATDTVREAVTERNTGIVKHSRKVQLKPESMPVREHQPLVEVRELLIDRLPLAKAVTMPWVVRMPQVQALAMVPDVASAQLEEQDEEKTTLWDRLPIDELKKQQMHRIVTGLAHAYREVHDAKQDLDETAVSVKVEKRKIIFSF